MTTWAARGWGYLNRASETMDAVLSRTGDNLPEVLEGRDVAKAFYGVVSEVMEGLGAKETPVPCRTEMAADVAVQIDEIIQERLKVDWRGDLDLQNGMRNAIDDLLYDVKSKGGMPLSAQDMDGIIERALDIARARYA